MIDEAGDSDGAIGKPTEPRVPLSVATPPEAGNLDFLARLSHEMRTPLSAILGHAQLMGSAANPPSAAQRRSLDLILQAGWHLEKLVKSTCDLALIESGDLPLSLERLSLAALMTDCAAMIESAARMRAMRATFPVFDTPCWVSADAVRLQQVLGDLLAAAIEGTAVGGALLVDCTSGHPEWLGITIRGAATGAQIAVDDSGICVLLAKRLIALMGGAFEPQCDGESGSIFSFKLKRADLPNAASYTSTHSRLPSTAAATSVANVFTG